MFINNKNEREYENMNKNYETFQKIKKYFLCSLASRATFQVNCMLNAPRLGIYSLKNNS